MQGHDAIERVGQVPAPLGLAHREGLVLAVVGVGQVVDAREQRPEVLAVAHDAADRDAAEAGAVVAALPPDQPLPRALAAHVVVRDGDLERRVDRLRPGVGEEHVVEVGGRQRRDAGRELEGLGVAELEGGREVELGRLLLDGAHDRLAGVARVGAPQARGAVHHGAALGRVVVHVLGARDHPRALLEGAVRGERHPPRVEVVRRRDVVGGLQSGPAAHGHASSRSG